MISRIMSFLPGVCEIPTVDSVVLGRVAAPESRVRFHDDFFVRVVWSFTQRNWKHAYVTRNYPRTPGCYLSFASGYQGLPEPTGVITVG
jgi:hypothetical protein